MINNNKHRNSYLTLENNRVELYNFYNTYKEYKLFMELDEKQLEVIQEYFKEFSFRKVCEVEKRGSLAYAGVEYLGSECKFITEIDNVYTINSEDAIEKVPISIYDEYRLNMDKTKQVSSYIAYKVKLSDNDKVIYVTLDVLKGLIPSNWSLIEAVSIGTLEELKYLVYLKVSNNTRNYIEYNYTRLPLALRNKYCNHPDRDACEKFYSLFLALPEYLVDIYNTKIDTIYQKEIFKQVTNKFSQSEQDLLDVLNSQCQIVSLCRQIIVNTFEEDKQNRVGELLCNYVKIYNKLTNNGKVDLMNLVKAGLQQVVYVKAKNGDRIATKSEKKAMVSACYKKNIFFIDQVNWNKLMVFTWANNGNVDLLIKSGTVTYQDVIDIKNNGDDFNSYFIDNNTDKVISILEDAMDYMISPSFLKEDIINLRKGTKAIEYLDSAEDEIRDMGLVKKLEVVKKATAGDNLNSYNKMAYDIAFKALKYGNPLTEKQTKVINTVYENVIAKDKPNQGEPDVNNKFSQQLVSMMLVLNEYNQYKAGTFMYNLIDSIKKKQKCSQKQYNIIESEYEKIRIIPTNDASSVDEIPSSSEYESMSRDYYESLKNRSDERSGIEDIYYKQDKDTSDNRNDNQHSVSIKDGLNLAMDDIFE